MTPAPLRVAISLAALLALGCAPSPAPPAPASQDRAGLASAAPARALDNSSRSARVERAVDGDTLVLADGDRVRLLGIDTPEMRDESPLLRALAERAHRALAETTEGRDVRLVVGPEPRDRYDRLLARIEVDENGAVLDVGYRLLATGVARVYPAEHEWLARYLAVEAEARARGDGVWVAEARRAWGPRAELVLAPSQAAAHLGTIARVEGRLVSSRRTDKVLFLTLADETAQLKVVAFTPRLFPPEVVASWTDRIVAVTGKLKEYEGAPELVIERPDQVEIPASDTMAPHPR